jgi:hypothetical protein
VDPSSGKSSFVAQTSDICGRSMVRVSVVEVAEVL